MHFAGEIKTQAGRRRPLPRTPFALNDPCRAPLNYNQLTLTPHQNNLGSYNQDTENQDIRGENKQTQSLSPCASSSSSAR